MKYVIKTGQLFDNQGHLIGVGYSGHGAGLNNPGWTHVVAVGPLPVGTYTVGDPRDPVDHLGPIAMPLEPADDNEMFGRGGFFMHGDNAQNDHSASDGCIIMPHNVRQLVCDNDDDQLEVIAQ